MGVSRARYLSHLLVLGAICQLLAEKCPRFLKNLGKLTVEIPLRSSSQAARQLGFRFWVSGFDHESDVDVVSRKGLSSDPCSLLPAVRRRRQLRDGPLFRAPFPREKSPNL